MTTCQLRAATDADRDRIAEIWHSSASLPNVGPRVMPTCEALRARLDEEMTNGWVVTVAHIDHEIAGFAAMTPTQSRLAELFVCPRHLGNGIGKLLLDHAKSVMRNGFSLFTTSRNYRARQFYEREGLVIEREDRHPRSGHPVTYYRWNAR